MMSRAPYPGETLISDINTSLPSVRNVALPRETESSPRPGSLVILKSQPHRSYATVTLSANSGLRRLNSRFVSHLMPLSPTSTRAIRVPSLASSFYHHFSRPQILESIMRLSILSLAAIAVSGVSATAGTLRKVYFPEVASNFSQPHISPLGTKYIISQPDTNPLGGKLRYVNNSGVCGK